MKRKYTFRDQIRAKNWSLRKPFTDQPTGRKRIPIGDRLIWSRKTAFGDQIVGD